MKDVMEKILVSFLNIRPDEIESLIIDESTVYVRCKRKAIRCPRCGRTMNSHGFYPRSILIPGTVLRDYTVKLQIRRYACKPCGITESDQGHMAKPNRKLSHSAVNEIMELLKSPKMTFKEVSEITSIPLSTVIRAFDENAHIPRKPFPEALCIDEVYTRNSDFDSKYSCILYDFLSHKIIDVLPSRKKNHLHYYMKYIPEKERDNVKYVCIDMYETYRSIAYRYFKKATICVDSFHVVKHLNDDLKDVRIRIMKRYPYTSQEYYLLKNFNFLLMNRNIDLDNERRFNRKMDRYLNYQDILSLILSIDEDLEKAYNLKEEYSLFNETSTYEEARENFDTLVNDFIKADIGEYREFVSLLIHYRKEIINSFIKIDGARINNGIAESINQNVAALIYNSKGIRNSLRRRKRIMYSINKDKFNLY